MSEASEALGYPRASRGAPALGDRDWGGEVQVMAQRVAATWQALADHKMRSGVAGSRGRLRLSLTKHAPDLLRLFNQGARVSQFARALIACGVMLDSGGALQPLAVNNTWVRVEGTLAVKVSAKRMAS